MLKCRERVLFCTGIKRLLLARLARNAIESTMIPCAILFHVGEGRQSNRRLSLVQRILSIRALFNTSTEMCEGGSTSGPRPSRTICEDTCRDSTSLSTSRPRPLRGKVFPDVEGVTQSRMILTEGFASSFTEHALTRSGFDYSNSSRRRGSHPIKDESRKHEMILAATNSPNEGGVWAARVVLAARISPN